MSLNIQDERATPNLMANYLSHTIFKDIISGPDEVVLRKPRLLAGESRNIGLEMLMIGWLKAAFLMHLYW